MAFRTELPKLTDRLKLGADLTVSPFCLGMVESPNTVSAAFDAGINFFFCTADMHWPLYESSRRGLIDLLARGGGIRDRIVVACVSYVTQPEFCHAPFMEMIASIPGLERLDLTVAGGATPGDFERRKVQYQGHRGLGAKTFGASFHNRPFAAETIGRDEVDIGFVRFNALHRGAEVDLFPKAQVRHGKLMYGFKSVLPLVEERLAAAGLGPNHWRPKPTDHYRYALSHSDLDGILCSPTEPAHIRELADALDHGPLSPDRYTYMGDLADLLHGKARLRTAPPSQASAA